MRAQPDQGPTRVAIIGGGCAGLTAAFELTRPELRGRYQVTVYQMGWRLGGKGASGRGVHGRIEEHGLHLWMGYYENAFRLMRRCYAELDTDRSAGSEWRFEDAFVPANFNGTMDWSPSGTWMPWTVEFPKMPGLPGDPDPPRLDVVDFLLHAARLLKSLLSTFPNRGADPGEATGAPPQAEARAFSASEDDLASAVARFARLGAAAGLTLALEAVSWLEMAFSGLPRYPQELVARLLDIVTDLTRSEIARFSEGDDGLRRASEVAELILAALRGSTRFRLAFDPRGFDAIDDYDCRQWLKMNGASDRAVNSGFIRALYDLAFAYAGGDPERPAIAAGSALRGAFRAFFTYRGAFFWKMGAGMGDVVFAPLYRALHRRGVRFEFFHKLTSVGLSAPSDHSPHVAMLDFDLQARTLTGEDYRPLCTVKGLSCWPAHPALDQLVDGAALGEARIDFESQWDRRMAHRKTLRVGKDFDFVVLAVGLGAVRSVCGSIVERDERWQEMLERVTSVPTQAFQLWLNRDMRQLGWSDRPVNISGFVEPFDTWADMTHVVPREEWTPATIAYFCNVLRDEPQPCDGPDATAFVARAHEEVRGRCIEFLDGHLRALWPGSTSPEGRFVWDALYAPDRSSSGPKRFDTQYWTANVRPSDRYTQCLPGSTKYRISPLDRTYDNLTIAGDWTSCSLNMGCVEAAVMSGMLAAHALSGFPHLGDIVGYDHP